MAANIKGFEIKEGKVRKAKGAGPRSVSAKIAARKNAGKPRLITKAKAGRT